MFILGSKPRNEHPGEKRCFFVVGVGGFRWVEKRPEAAECGKGAKKENGEGYQSATALQGKMGRKKPTPERKSLTLRLRTVTVQHT